MKMKWEKREVTPGQVKDIAAKYGCDLLAASVLARRGITQGADIRYFLEDDPRYLRNPFELSGMEDAVERVLAAKEEGEKILVFGDRDVDGITGAAMVTEFLRSQGMDVRVRIPEGDEPYGLSVEAVEEFASDYGTLIITVDCGISNTAEIQRAAELGVDVIVTDHHNVQEEIPAALAIVNPKLGAPTPTAETPPGTAAAAPYPFGDLSGCGVAYKLVSALRFAMKSAAYGETFCLLNTRPVNDAWVIEVAKLRNLVVIGNLAETVVPGALSIGDTRLPAFLEGQQILVWDAAPQKRALKNIFGSGVEIGMLDVAPEIGKVIPGAAGKSLVRIKELSKIARYEERETGELDVFVNIFSSFLREKEKFFCPDDAQDLQLACLGTVADIMPLRDENRVIVKQGLASLMKKPRPGLSDLLFKLELSGRRVGVQDISWFVCPAINAAGRVGNPRKALDLLIEEDPLKRDRLATELIGMNEERKKMGDDAWTLVEPMAERSMETYGNKLAVACDPSIPRGVTGIMANRLINRFKVPALVASHGSGIVTASLRSLRGYDLRRLLEPMSSLFIDWGGHNYAAGFSISAPGNWETFLERLKAAAGEILLADEEDRETIAIDASLPFSHLGPDIMDLVDRFEPYGEGNEALIFMAQGMKVNELSLMGKSEARHVKLTLDAGKHKWPAVYWQAAEKVKREFDLGDTVDAAFKITRNWWKGVETPQMVIIDLKRHEQ